MRRIHFKKLESHRVPVLQLYKTILRNALHLPLPQPDVHTIHSEIALQFRQGRSSMAITKTQLLLNKAQLWSDHIYNAVRDSKSESNSSLDWIKSQLHQHLKDTAMKERRLQDQQIKIDTRPQGDDLKILQSRSRYTVFKHRLLRSYQKSCRVSRKSPLDDTYINSVLLPEFMARKDEKKLQQRRAIETGSPQTARLAYIPTPVGTVYFLRYPPKKMKRNLASYIHNHIHTNVYAKIDKLNDLMVLAAYEASWEYEMQSEKPLHDQISSDRIAAEWRNPIESSIKQLNYRIWQSSSSKEQHLDILLRRKRQKDRVYLRRYQGKLEKWRLYDLERQKDPLRFMMHYNVRKSM